MKYSLLSALCALESFRALDASVSVCVCGCVCVLCVCVCVCVRAYVRACVRAYIFLFAGRGGVTSVFILNNAFKNVMAAIL